MKKPSPAEVAMLQSINSLNIDPSRCKKEQKKEDEAQRQAERVEQSAASFRALAEKTKLKKERLELMAEYKTQKESEKKRD